MAIEDLQFGALICAIKTTASPHISLYSNFRLAAAALIAKLFINSIIRDKPNTFTNKKTNQNNKITQTSTVQWIYLVL